MRILIMVLCIFIHPVTDFRYTLSNFINILFLSILDFFVAFLEFFIID
jgi:hypothetical protein